MEGSTRHGFLGCGFLANALARQEEVERVVAAEEFVPELFYILLRTPWSKNPRDAKLSRTQEWHRGEQSDSMCCVLPLWLAHNGTTHDRVQEDVPRSCRQVLVAESNHGRVPHVHGMDFGFRSE